MSADELNYGDAGFWGKVGIDSLLGGLNFLLGFVIGTVIDVAFYKLYQAVDPKETKVWLLIPFILVQIMFSIFLVVIVSPIFKPESVYGSYFRIALLASQVFMMGYALNKVSKNIYDRDNDYSPIVAHLIKGGKKPPKKDISDNPYKVNNPAVF